MFCVASVRPSLASSTQGHIFLGCYSFIDLGSQVEPTSSCGSGSVSLTGQSLSVPRPLVMIFDLKLCI